MKNNATVSGVSAAKILRTAAAFAVVAFAWSCAASDIVFSNKAFELAIAGDASVKSLRLSGGGEEFLEIREGTPLFTVTQERPFNNEI